MNTYLSLFLIALFSSLLLTPIIRRLAQRLDWLDRPRGLRKIHERAIPRLGGIAIFLSIAAALAVLPLIDNLVTRSLRTEWKEITAVLVSSSLVFLFGIFDDLHGSRARWKLLVQILAGVVLYALGGRIEAISLPFIGSTSIPPVLGFGLTVIWVVGISNAFNLIDGMDGLAAGASLFATLVMLVVSFSLGNVFVTIVLLTLAGSLIGFLRYNFNPASIFLGDSGALFIGFLLAALSLTGSQKASTAVAIAIPLMAFGMPVIDTALAITRRFISGKPLFEGDLDHIHHKLLERGWSQRRVAFVLYGVCAFFGLVALLFARDGGIGHLTGLILVVVGAAVILVAGRLRYDEADELKASVKRNFGERRIRAANHVRVRRVTREISRVETLSELFTALRELMKLGEFVYATMQLGQAEDYRANRRILVREDPGDALRGVSMRGNLICWEWERGDIEANEILGSHLFWTLRVPLYTNKASWGFINFYREVGGDGLLLDVNYLSSLLQHELALAIERIFEQRDSRSAAGPVRVRAARGAAS
jgi:UDP-GlcNAc:undecaprenyl-phosphate GlcNAc-1-phosphate transferase